MARLGRLKLPEATVDLARLAAMMKALSSPVRLELLQTLRSPRLLTEIRLSARKPGQGQPGRTMNRVSVREHLGSLIEIGAVRVIPLHRDGRLMKHFVLGYGQLFALTEELRQLARLQPESGLSDGTMPAPKGRTGSAIERPQMVQVNGICEGQIFPLPLQPGPRTWLVGRSADADILLEYDPYVSTENSRIVFADGRFSIVDLATSRNGTTVNWEPLPKNELRPLANGDVVGVGRSILVFRT